MTVTVYGTFWPHSKKSPSTGVLTVTVGVVLPTVIVSVFTSELPFGSFTTSCAV